MLLSKTKKVAVLGVMAAFSTVLLVLGTVISVNTVFFTAAAAFLSGIAVVLYGFGYGAIFYAVCALLDFFMNPNKFHVLLYLFFAGYILVSEALWKGMKRNVPETDVQEMKKKERIHKIARFAVFAACYVPMAVFLPELLVPQKFIRQAWFYPGIAGAGIVGWFLYDIAYGACKRFIWDRFRINSLK